MSYRFEIKKEDVATEQWVEHEVQHPGHPEEEDNASGNGNCKNN